MLGKTAYAKGQKLYGTLIAQAEEGYPTYGTDTSNATATEADIAYGKTAYARGQLLIGTAQNMSPDVEEIYGPSKENFKTNNYNLMSNNQPDDQEELKSVGLPVFSHNGNYLVRTAIGISEAKYIESFEVNNNGLVYHVSSNVSGNTVVKKYRYTYEELGLPVEANILDIAFGAEGYAGNSNQCILSILYKVDDITYLRLLTYHLIENGQIGSGTGYPNVSIEQTVEVKNGENVKLICGSKTNSNDFFLYDYDTPSLGYPKLSLRRIKINSSTSSSNHNITYYDGEKIEDRTLNWYQTHMENTKDGRYVLVTMQLSSASSTSVSISAGPSVLFKTDENTPSKAQVISGGYTQASLLVLGSKNTWLCFGAVSGEIIGYRTNFYYANGQYKVGSNVSVRFKIPDWEDFDYVVGIPYLTSDESKILITIGKKAQATSTKLLNPKIVVINADDILSGQLNEEFEVTEVYTYSNDFNFDMDTYICAGNSNGTKIMVCNTSQNMVIFTKTTDTENLIGIFYKNNFFGIIKPEQLTAGGPDVRKGKTYIGWMGYPETGIAEF